MPRKMKERNAHFQKTAKSAGLFQAAPTDTDEQ